MTLRALLVVLVGGAAQTPQPTPLDTGSCGGPESEGAMPLKVVGVHAHVHTAADAAATVAFLNGSAPGPELGSSWRGAAVVEPRDADGDAVVASSAAADVSCLLAKGSTVAACDAYELSPSLLSCACDMPHSIAAGNWSLAVSLGGTPVLALALGGRFRRFSWTRSGRRRAASAAETGPSAVDPSKNRGNPSRSRRAARGFAGPARAAVGISAVRRFLDVGARGLGVRDFYKVRPPGARLQERVGRASGRTPAVHDFQID